MPINKMFALIQNGETSLHIASRKGNVTAVKMLTRTGANTNIKNNVSCTLFVYLQFF